MGLKIVSCYDGMSCGQIAFNQLGLDIDTYVAYEIDKYAIQVTQHNLPNTIQMGDMFKGDFTQYQGFDWLIGGSPCTYWSIAQKNNRETEASGLGWKLFSQYVRALKEVKPKYFLYENNKSMSNAIRESISNTFGFEPICINSALVSAQNRQRLYWVGIRQEDGSYRKANIEQPQDRGILLRDILETGMDLSQNEKAYCLTNGACAWNTIERKQREPIKIGEIGKGGQGNRIYSFDGKSVTITSQSGGIGSNTGLYAKPIRIGDIGSTAQSHRVYSCDGKSVTISASGGGQGGKTGLYTCPINTTPDGKSQTIKAQYNRTSIVNICCYSSTYGATGVACQTNEKPIPFLDNKIKDKNAINRVYEVKNGKIIIKGKEYPISLKDGYYIIRKLTVNECKRLQTVPDWYDMTCISKTQAYKCLGNGWTVEVIMHLISSAMSDNT